MRRLQATAGGLKVSAQGYDPATAGEDNLLLNLAVNRPQIVMSNVFVAATPSSVPLTGFTATPLVFVYRYAINGMFNHNGTGLTSVFMRPNPNVRQDAYAAAVVPTFNNLAFYGGNGTPIRYVVFKEAL